MADLFLVVLLFIILAAIVIYVHKKNKINLRLLNITFYIVIANLIFIPFILSYWELSGVYIIIFHVIAAAAVLLLNIVCSYYLFDKKRKSLLSSYLIYLILILIFTQYINNYYYPLLLSKILIAVYFLDICVLIKKDKIISAYYKNIALIIILSWVILDFFTIFFNNDILNLLSVIFALALAVEFFHIKVSLMEKKISKFDRNIMNILDDFLEAFFIVDIEDFTIKNYNNLAAVYFNLNNNGKNLQLKNIFSANSFLILKNKIKKAEETKNLAVKTKIREDFFEEWYIDIRYLDFKQNNEVLIILKDKSKENILKNRLAESKNKITKLHHVAIEMQRFEKKEEVYQLTVKTAQGLLDYDVISLDIVKGNRLVTVCRSKNITNQGVKPMDLDEPSLAAKTYHTQQSYICANVRKDKNAAPVKNSYKSAISVPIDKFGVFQIISEEYDYFKDQDKQIVEILISHAIAALKRLKREEDLKYFGFHDYLTGLYNRDYLEEEIKRLDNKRSLPLSVIIGDVNGLKLINDTFGHHQGDQLLKNIAEILDSTSRHTDILGRWGGDEFLIVLPHTTKQDAKSLIHRIKNNLKVKDYEGIPLSISFGKATKIKESEDIKDIINEADRLMYNNKSKCHEKHTQQMLNVLYNKLHEMGHEKKEHCQRVMKMSEEFALHLNLDKDEIKDLKKAARLHDIGMINISSDIVCKNDELTEEEYEIIKSHTEIGFRIANSLNESSEISHAILFHHEWWNGKGYPDRRQGKEIPLFARIISITDAFDIMINDQVYREKMSKEKAVKKIKKRAGTQFDPELVEIFVNEVI